MLFSLLPQKVQFIIIGIIILSFFIGIITLIVSDEYDMKQKTRNIIFLYAGVVGAGILICDWLSLKLAQKMGIALTVDNAGISLIELVPLAIVLICMLLCGLFNRIRK